MEYIIVADYEIYGKVETCLVVLAGKSKENAERVLAEVLANPVKYRAGENPRIETVENKDCWWNQGGLD